MSSPRPRKAAREDLVPVCLPAREDLEREDLAPVCLPAREDLALVCLPVREDLDPVCLPAREDLATPRGTTDFPPVAVVDPAAKLSE